MHIPFEEIRVVSVEPIAQMPPPLDSSCASRWEILDDLFQETVAGARLVTLQARGKKYGYYARGEALLLCPVQLP